MRRPGGSWLEGGLQRDLSFLRFQTFTGISSGRNGHPAGPTTCLCIEGKRGKKTHTEKNQKCSFKELGPRRSARNSRTRVPGLVVESASSCTGDSVAVTGDKGREHPHLVSLLSDLLSCHLGLVAFCLLEAEAATALLQD